MLAHVKNPNDLFQGVKKIINKKGIFIVEAPSLLNIIKDNQYDNIFHEHIGFHSLKSLIDLAKRNNLNLFDVEHIDSQGGSIRCYICKKNNPLKVSQKIKLILREETQLGLYSSSQLKSFKNKIISHISDMQSLIKKIKNMKKRISVYGASGKGQALLQYCNLNNKTIDFVFDKSKLKQNCFTPGTLIKIKHPKDIKKQKLIIY